MADENELPEEELPPVEEPQPEPEPVVARYAQVQDGYVLNVALWDGVAALELPEGQTLVACGEEPVGPGWTYDGEAFVAPPVPEPARRLIAKSVIIRRLHEADKLADTLALLDQPENLYARERWRTPDWPNVYFDDPDLIAVLTAVGADVEAITAEA